MELQHEIHNGRYLILLCSSYIGVVTSQINGNFELNKKKCPMMRSQEISLNRNFTYWWCLTVPMQKDSEKNKLPMFWSHFSQDSWNRRIDRLCQYRCLKEDRNIFKCYLDLLNPVKQHLVTRYTQRTGYYATQYAQNMQILLGNINKQQESRNTTYSVSVFISLLTVPVVK